MYNILAVFIGGGLGSLARYGISEFVKLNFRSVFPIATLCSNVLSCVVLALAVGLFADKISPGMKLFMVAGFCGGFSTFSTFSFETIELMRTGNTLIALFNVLISVIICFAIVFFLTRTSAS